MELAEYIRVHRQDGRKAPAAGTLARLAKERSLRRFHRAKRRLQQRLGGVRTSDARLIRAMGCRTRSELLTQLESHRSRRFFFQPETDELVTTIRQSLPEAIDKTLDAADDVCLHTFDLLGSGRVVLGSEIDWQLDFKTGHRWSAGFCFDIPQRGRTAGADIKMPRELNRCQHFSTLGRAYRYSQNEKYAQEFVAQLGSWAKENPPWIGINWCSPMEAALRIVSWTLGYFFFQHSPSFDTDARLIVLKGLLAHAEFVGENLEYFGPFSGNHYLADLVGLLTVGTVFPEFRQANRWRRLAHHGLEEQMQSQVLGDGVHFEDSTSYHRFVLEILTFAAVLGRLHEIDFSDSYWRRLERMFDYVHAYTRPDGTATQIGDNDNGRLLLLGTAGITDHRYLLSIGSALFDRSDFKIAAGKHHEEAYWLLGLDGKHTSDRLPDESSARRSASFPDGGAYFLRDGDDYLAATCSPTGRLGRGSHSHNDCLSFELCVGGKPLIVDPGGYVYSAEPDWRNKFRSSRYHNTLVVDGQEMNRYDEAKIFRMSRDARTWVTRHHVDTEVEELEASHSGYQRLADPVTHHRRFRFSKGAPSWLIEDRIEGRAEHRLEWYFHFDPAVELTLSGGQLIARLPGGPSVVLECRSDHALLPVIEDGWYSPSYGIKVPAPIVRFERTARLPLTTDFVITPRGDTQ